jgi:hypothetical protein
MLNGTPVSGQTASTYTTTTLNNSDVVTVQLTSNASPCLTGSPATSSGITITVAVLAASISGTNVLCFGNATGAANLTVSGGTTAYTYLWSNGATTEDLNSLAAGTYNVTVTDANGCTTTASVTITQPASAPIAAITNNTGSTVLTCATTAISVTASGGVSYSWSGGLGTSATASITTPGTYTVTATSVNGCTDTEVITITQDITAPTAAISYSGTPYCATGTTSVTQTGQSGGTYTSTAGLSINASTGAINLAASTAGTYTVTYTFIGSNGCGNSTTTSVTINALPGTIITPSGPVSFCQGGSVLLTASAGTSWLWSNGSTNQTLFVNTSGTYSVTTTANGCQSISSPVVVTVTPYPVLTYTGSTYICQGSSTTLTVSGASSYTWLPANILNTATGNTVVATPLSNPTTVTVTGNTNGCIASEDIFIVLEPLVNVGVTISASSQTIISGQSVTFTATPQNGGSNPTYQWYVNGAVVSGATSVTYTTNSLTNNAAVYVVMNSNITSPCIANNPATSNTITITVQNCILGSINGTQILCGFENATFSVNHLPCITSYDWVVPDGMTIIDNPAPGNSIDVYIDALSFTGGNIVVTAYFQGGGSSQQTLSVTNVPFAPQLLTTSSCGIPGTTVTFEVVAVPGVNQYIWTQPSNSSLLFGQYTDSVRVKFGSLFNSGNISVVASNACGNSPATEFFILAPPKIPLAINGSNIVCNALPNQLFYVDSVAHASYYIWGMPSGATIVSTPNTNDSINVAFNNFINGAISVKSANVCGSSTMRYLFLTTPVLAPAQSISGPTNVCQYIIPGTPVNYSTALINGITNYNWNVPSGVTINSGQGTNQIQVVFTSNFTSGSISVTLNNGCSISTATSLALIATPASNLGSISGPVNVCQNIGTGQVVYSVTPVSGATYNWSVPSGVTLISGQGTNSITVAFTAGFVSGQITLTAQFSCGPQAIRTLAVSKLPSAAQAISGPSCISAGSTYTYSTVSVPGATSYNWAVPANATINSGQGTSTISVTFNSMFASGSLSVTPTNSCGQGTASTYAIGLIPAVPAEIFGPLTACPGDILTYNVAPIAGASYYIWVLPSGMTFNGPVDGNSISVAVGPSFISGLISCKSVTSCGSSTMRYSSTISVANCTPPLALGNIISAQREYKYSDLLLRKIFVSEVFDGQFTLVIENENLIGSLNLTILDKNSGEIIHIERLNMKSDFNRFNIEFNNYEQTEYMLNLKDDNESILFQYPLIIIND